MSHFASYNTSDANTGNLPLAANASITPMTLVGAKEGLLVGTVYSDVAGTLTIQQSFDGANWDVQNVVAVTAGTGPGTGVEINQVIYAPFVVVDYLNSGTIQTIMRLFLRTTGVRGT